MSGRSGGDSPEGLYKDVLDHMLEGCQILGFDWRYLYLNHAAEVHNRRPNAELLGQPYARMWPGIEATEVYRLIGDCLETRTPHTMENHFTYPDGQQGWFELRLSPVPEGVFIMSLDISDRKRMETDLKRAEDQLHRAQRLEAIGRLAGGIAHDFNNLVSVILGHVELAIDDAAGNDEVQEHLRSVQHAAGRAADLTRQLLAFARRQTIEPRVIDIDAAIGSSLDFLRRLIGEHIDLQWHPADGLHAVRLDPTQLEQILTNLCLNARDAIAGNGRIVIETDNLSLDEAACAGRPGFRPGDFVELTVTDNGAGMTREVAEHIFEPFFTTKDVGRGTGLGLATVYGIVKQNDGFINVYSEPGRGTTLRICFAREAQAPAAVPAEVPVEAASDGHGTVLLVEDEELILTVSCSMLERSGFRVLGAGTPGAAIRLAEQHARAIDILVTDVVMPEMSGPELARRVCAIVPGVKVLFMSGYTANVIAHQGILDAGVNFLPKPFTRQQLVLKIRQVLGERPA